MDDPTLDPSLTSWVPVPEGSDFPIQNLPFGRFTRAGDRTGHVGVAIGNHVLDLHGCKRGGLLEGLEPAGDFALLNRLLAANPGVWRAVRERVSELLSDDGNRSSVEPHLLRMEEVALLRPVYTRDYVDFYSSMEHATNMGRMLRPDREPLLPNWRWLPVGYHGRSGTLVPSGTPIKRPRGQIQSGDDPPVYGPTQALDFELEVGFVTGWPTRAGEPISIERARDHIFGLVLVNDWSARDIQRWEYQPLGPFLGKSFATSISPWVVTLDALEPFRVPAPRQDPSPLPHLRLEDDHGYDVNLEVAVAPPGLEVPVTLSRTNLRYLYWTVAQQLAHATSNGAAAEPGDLFASGTISGPSPGSYGSLIELTWRGERPIQLPDGSSRTFLEDGDTVVMRGWSEAPGRPRIGFGELRGTVVPNRSG
ncbi:MAG TPA: fumarylacetoacetase [Actinomycetota bacterium]|nr:fumarylacetoacetase [Actinomycetota bacterium]